MLKSEQLPQQSSRLHSSVVSCRPPFFGPRHITANDQTESTMLSRKLTIKFPIVSARRRSLWRSSRVFELCERLQSCPSSEPLERHLDINSSLLGGPGRVRPIHAPASEGIEPIECRCHEKFASWEGIFTTYVIELDIPHALPLRLPNARRSCASLMVCILFRHRRKDEGEA
jgi:hypothetical protein